MKIKCSECNSDRHPTTLHPRPAQWVSKSSTPRTEYGGEKGETPEAAVVSKCTEVCGEGFNGKACSKICLVTVYPAGNRSKGKRMYAMLDGQSNRSWVQSSLICLVEMAPHSLTLWKPAPVWVKQLAAELQAMPLNLQLVLLVFPYPRSWRATWFQKIEMKFPLQPPQNYSSRDTTTRLKCTDPAVAGKGHIKSAQSAKTNQRTPWRSIRTKAGPRLGNSWWRVPGQHTQALWSH